MSSVPPSPGYFSDNPFASSDLAGNNPSQSPQGYDPNQPRRGLVNQVRVMAVLNAVQGGLECVLALVYLGLGGMFIAMKAEIAQQQAQPGNPMEAQMANLLPIFFFILGGVLLLLAVLRVIAGVLNFSFRGRVLGIVTMLLGLASSLTLYCAPTSIGIAVYGLIVLFNRPVAEAFEMRAQGSTSDQVLAVMNSRPT